MLVCGDCCSFDRASQTARGLSIPWSCILLVQLCALFGTVYNKVLGGKYEYILRWP